LDKLIFLSFCMLFLWQILIKSINQYFFLSKYTSMFFVQKLNGVLNETEKKYRNYAYICVKIKKLVNTNHNIVKYMQNKCKSKKNYHFKS